MYPNYLPVFFLATVAVVIVGGILVGTHLLGPRKRTHVKYDIPYESGVDPSGDARLRFDVKFYLVAMLFVVFDLEVVYFYPWAVVFRDMVRDGMGILWIMLVFTVFLVVGLVHEWKKGALDWK